MKKLKCDKCQKRFTILSDFTKVYGKPKHKMDEKEMAGNYTHIGDNKTFEKRYCGDCR